MERLQPRAISRRQFYFYAMKLRDRMVAAPPAEGPYWTVPRLDDFLRQVDRYPCTNLRDMVQEVLDERQRLIFMAQAAWAGAALLAGLSVLLAIFSSLELCPRAAGGWVALGLLVAAGTLIGPALRWWDRARQRMELAHHLESWQQALAGVREDESLRLLEEGQPPTSQARPWHSRWN